MTQKSGSMSPDVAVPGHETPGVAPTTVARHRRPAGRATVVIPALNEAHHIADVVRYALADPECAEVIVVDDSSLDETAKLARDAGATVITSTMLGKGASMEDGAGVAEGDIVVYLDGDLHNLDPGIVSKLVEPIANNRCDMAKAAFGRGGGRVTELTAKPMLRMFFPELAHIAQPLGGIVAARKSLLREIRFEPGYGADVGLLIDAHEKGARIAQVSIGSIDHDSQPLAQLAVMAQEVSRVIVERAHRLNRLSVDHLLDVFEMERQNMNDIDGVILKLGNARRLALFDMDGTITRGRFVTELARATSRSSELAKLLRTDDDATRSDEIARLFRMVPKKTFEQVAREMPLREGITGVINDLRRRGYCVGVVSDSYYVAAEILRRRIFADFAVAHTIQFDRGICSGELRLNRAFRRGDGCARHDACKSNVLRYLTSTGRNSFDHIIAVGDNYNDLCMLEYADTGLAIDPKHPILLRSRRVTPISQIEAVGRYVRDTAICDR